MLITFFDIRSTVHFEFIPQGLAVNQTYVEILKQLRESVYRKRPEIWPNDWIRQHDNAPAHKALSVKQFLVQKSITGKKHPAYSPNTVPNDFWLFSKIRLALKGRRFQDIEHTQKM
jgi:hypothetical protein